MEDSNPSADMPRCEDRGFLPHHIAIVVDERVPSSRSHRLSFGQPQSWTFSIVSSPHFTLENPHLAEGDALFLSR